MAIDPEIKWRVQALESQMPADRKAPIPLLQARPETEIREGFCLSCGDPMAEKPIFNIGRCPFCREAAKIACRRIPVAFDGP